jgi:hypothetical protein
MTLARLLQLWDPSQPDTVTWRAHRNACSTFKIFPNDSEHTVTLPTIFQVCTNILIIFWDQNPDSSNTARSKLYCIVLHRVPRGPLQITPTLHQPHFPPPLIPPTPTLHITLPSTTHSTYHHPIPLHKHITPFPLKTFGREEKERSRNSGKEEERKRRKEKEERGHHHFLQFSSISRTHFYSHFAHSYSRF